MGKRGPKPGTKVGPRPKHWKKPGVKPGTKLGPRGRDNPVKKYHRERMRRARAKKRREEARRKG